MTCPFCESEKIVVLNTYQNYKYKNRVRRLRRCQECKKSFHTMEYVEDRIKEDEIISDYLNKLLRSLK